MKMVFYLGLFLTATLLSFGQTAEKKATAQIGEPKREQHVKVVVSQNGKVVKIDTTFNFADEKVTKFKVDSILKTLDVVHSGSGDRKFIVIRDDSSAVKGEKKITLREKGGNVTMFDGEGDLIPLPQPPPPVPGMPGMHVKSFRMHGGDPFAMDPNDGDIISYDKKDIGKGREKITIVRKKRPENHQTKEVNVQVEVKDF